MRKSVLTFLIGAFTGAGGCYIYMKHYYDKLLTYTYEDINPEKGETELDESEVNGEVIINHKPDLVVNARKRPEYTDYTKCCASKEVEDEDDSLLQFEHPVDSDEDEVVKLSKEEVLDMQGELLTEEINEKKGTGVEIITEDTFGSLAGYETVTVNYYVDDDVFATEEDDELIDEPDELFGDCPRRFKWTSSCSEGDCLFIRNYDLATDYEITPVFDSYSDEY